MLIESVAGLIAVRRRMIALRFGDAMREPLLSGVAIGLAAIGALSSEPKIDDLSHASAVVSPDQPCLANCADTVAGCGVAVRPLQKCC